MSIPDDTPGPHPDRAQAWQRVAELFDELVTESPETRDAVLSQAGISSEVRAWLDKLLAAHDRDQTIMIDRQITELVQQLMPGSKIMQDAEAFYERRFGPWQALDEIGRGGMGLVLHGKRADGQFDKRVAIKLLGPTRVGAELEQQLRQELRLLARLSHPAIAQVLDGGVADDGVPYLVMEYVDGVPITQFCDEQGLDLAQRLALFYRVAEAVSYCHRQLVIHGDIKPDNVLVNADGQVKLLDFGIANRLSESRDQDDDRDQTQRWCSPAYAAPERLEGAPPSVAEDVYALGAVLYELLSGGRIRSTSNITRVATQQSVPSEPIPASAMAVRRVQPSQRVRKLKGDLDRILVHALRDAPDQRYAGVDALVADLRNWQQQVPISLRTSETGYRLSRWLRRNRTLAAASSLVALALVVGLAAALWQANRAQQAAALAEQNAERATAAQTTAEQALARADQINRFLLDLFQAPISGLPPDELPTTRQIIDQGIASARDPAVGPPELRAEFLMSLAEILSARLQLDETEQLLNEIEQMVTLDDLPELALRHAVISADLARYRYQLDQAESKLQYAVELYKQHAPDDIRRLEMQRNLARVWRMKEQWDRAEQVLMDTQSEVQQREDGEPLALRIAGDLAIIAGSTGRHELALERFEQILGMKLALEHTPASIATTEVNIARLEEMLLRYDDAVNRYQSVIDRLDPYNEVPRGPRAVALTGLSKIARIRGQFELAEHRVHQALQEWARVRNLDRPEDDFLFYTYRAPLLAEQGRYAEAAELLDQGISIMLHSEEPAPRRIGQQLAKRARYWCMAGQFEKAESSLTAAREYEVEQVQTSIDDAIATCAFERSDIAPDPGWVPLELIEQTLAQTSDVSQAVRLELLRAELLMQTGQLDQGAELINRAEQRLLQVQVLTTHPLWQKIARLKSSG